MVVQVSADACNMEESSLFMQWAMNMRQQEHPAPAVDGGFGGISAPAAMDHDVWPLSPNSARHALASSSSGGGTILPVSWNFGASSAQPASVVGTLRAAATCGLPGSPYVVPPQPPPTTTTTTRRASLKSAGSLTSYGQEHIMSERKRREKINQRFIELSAVVPGLTKMDKVTILSDATRYVKEIQEKIRALEASGGDVRSTDAVVLSKKPCHAPSGAPMELKPLPDMEVQFCGETVTMRIHCENGKGVVVRVLAEVEELHLRIIDANVLPFPASTLIIAVTAKVQEGFTVTAEEIIGRLNSALSPVTTA